MILTINNKILGSTYVTLVKNNLYEQINRLYRDRGTNGVIPIIEKLGNLYEDISTFDIYPSGDIDPSIYIKSQYIVKSFIGLYKLKCQIIREFHYILSAAHPRREEVQPVIIKLDYGVPSLMGPCNMGSESPHDYGEVDIATTVEKNKRSFDRKSPIPNSQAHIGELSSPCVSPSGTNEVIPKASFPTVDRSYSQILYNTKLDVLQTLSTLIKIEKYFRTWEEYSFAYQWWYKVPTLSQEDIYKVDCGEGSKPPLATTVSTQRVLTVDCIYYRLKILIDCIDSDPDNILFQLLIAKYLK